jgi:hypothetical protein
MRTRYFAQVVGVVFLLVGILGFLPALKSSPQAGFPDLAVDGGYGLLLGLFPVNWLHNFVHIGIGTAGWSASRDRDSARQFAQGLTFFYGALAVMGLLPVLNTVFGLIPLYGHDIWLHAATAAVAAYFGFGLEAEAVETRENYRRAA